MSINRSARRAALALGAAGALGGLVTAVFAGQGRADTTVAAPARAPSSLAAASGHSGGTRFGRPIGAHAAAGGPLAFTGTSTIPVGNIQLCAQGDYDAVIDVHPAPVPGSEMTSKGVSSFVLPPGQCWIHALDTLGQSAEVDITGIDCSTGQTFSVGRTEWNSASGLGLGAEGTSGSPFWWEW